MLWQRQEAAEPLRVGTEVSPEGLNVGYSWEQPHIKAERGINPPLPAQHVQPLAGVVKRRVCGDGRGEREKLALVGEGFSLL